MKDPVLKMPILIFFGTAILTFCDRPEKKTGSSPPTESYTNGNYAPTVFPNDTTELWMAEGPMASDTVLIMGDGGPKNQLDYDYDGKIAMAYFRNFKDYYAVNLHQSSTYNKEIFNWKHGFTLEMAEREVDNSSEILHRAISYFKNRNKYVVVYGHSYSAFVIPHYLATRTSLADSYITTGGRITADSLQTAYQLKNINADFSEDGKTLVLPEENRPANPNRTRRYFKVRRAKNYLKAAIGRIDYSKELANTDISNWTFIYGTKDRNVGVPTKKELEFLESKQVKVIGVESDHYNIYKFLIDSLNAGTLQF